MEHTTTSSEETKKLAKKIGNSLNGGETLALIGEMGAGKTTFVQGLAEGLGIGSRVMSPTFVVMREHEGEKPIVLIHVDLYRFENNIEHEIDSLGLRDVLGKSKYVVAIEWAERARKLLPKDTIWIEFSGQEDKRHIKTNYEVIY